MQAPSGMYFYLIKEAHQQFVQNNFLSTLINVWKTLKVDQGFLSGSKLIEFGFWFFFNNCLNSQQAFTYNYFSLQLMA